MSRSTGRPSRWGLFNGFVDEDLRQFEMVWAAAGTPFAVFAIGPEELVKGCGGTAVDLKK